MSARRPDPEPDYGSPDCGSPVPPRKPLAYRIGYYVLAPLVVVLFLAALFAGIAVLVRVIGGGL